jgi:UDP-N-acetylmuramate--alanine ligase
VELFYSSAIPPGNVERVLARERGVPERPRAVLLAEFSALRRTIAVAGSHGKTTTAAMLVHALRAAEMDPGWLVGGSLGEGLGNAHWSPREWLVVEADESDRSLLSLEAEIAVLTNVELDHHATYSSLQELRGVFREFLARPRAAVVWARPELLALRADGVIAFDASDLALNDGGSSFIWEGLQVTLAVPGAHNALNAAAALEAARLAGADPRRAASALSSFHGAGRRFEFLGRTAAGALVYDDYAHHPTEVAATLSAARTLDHRRLLAIFQPHLYSRTAELAGEFGRALSLADAAIVLDVYPARERAADHPGVSGLLIAEASADAAGGRPVYWLPRFGDAEPVARDLARTGDLVVAMGAGDIDAFARSLVA